MPVEWLSEAQKLADFVKKVKLGHTVRVEFDDSFAFDIFVKGVANANVWGLVNYDERLTDAHGIMRLVQWPIQAALIVRGLELDVPRFYSRDDRPVTPIINYDADELEEERELWEAIHSIEYRVIRYKRTRR